MLSDYFRHRSLRDVANHVFASRRRIRRALKLLVKLARRAGNKDSARNPALAIFHSLHNAQWICRTSDNRCSSKCPSPSYDLLSSQSSPSLSPVKRNLGPRPKCVNENLGSNLQPPRCGKPEWPQANSLATCSGWSNRHTNTRRARFYMKAWRCRAAADLKLVRLTERLSSRRSANPPLLTQS